MSAAKQEPRPPTADCLPAFHHPEGRIDVCVSDVATPVPALDPWAVLALSISVVVVIALRKQA